MHVRTLSGLCAAMLSALSSACSHAGPAATAPSEIAGLALSPPSRPIGFPLGDAYLQMWGHALSSQPNEPLCTPLLVPPEGTHVVTPVWVDRDDGAWVARSAGGAGTIELRLRQIGDATLQGERIAGTAIGVAADSPVDPFYQATGVSVRLRGVDEPAATVWGVAAPSNTFIYGTMTGTFVFADRTGVGSTCHQLYWSLRPAAVVLRSAG